MLVFPIVLILVFPFAATQDVKNIRLAFVDQDHSVESRRLIEKTMAGGYFKGEATCASYDEALKLVQKGDADIVMQIAPDFARNLKRPEPSRVMIAANAVNGTKGSLGAAYLQQIVSSFGSEIQIEDGSQQMISALALSERYSFNQMLDYKRFMIPALMCMLLIMLTGFLPALNIVTEKERGTIEQINVTPVTRSQFILGKLIPYWIIGIVVLTIALLAGMGRPMAFAPRGLAAHALCVLPGIYHRHLRFWTARIELLRHYAAGHVRDVLLRAGVHAHERTLHTRDLHARLGAAYRLCQSAKILH